MKTYVLPLLFAAIAGSAHAAPPVQSFFETPQVSHVELSPKGGYVAAVLALPDGGSVLAVRSTDGDAQFQGVFKASADQTIYSVHWINEKRIGITVKNLLIEFQGNLEEVAVDRDGGELTHLITGNWGHRQDSLGSNIRSQKLTADYLYSAATRDGSDDILVEHYSWNNIDIAPDQSRMYRLNTRTRQLRPAVDGTQPPAVKDWMVDTYGQARIVLSQKNGRCIYSYRRAGENEWKELNNSGCYDSRFVPKFFDGNDTLYVRADYKGYGALYRYDLRTLKMEAEPIVSLPGFDFRGVPVIDYASHRLMGVHLYGDAGTTWWINPQLKAEQAKIDALLPGTTNTIDCADECLQGPVLLVSAASDRQPTTYVLYQRASGKLLALGSTHLDIAAKDMGLRDFHHYRARDGRQIPAYVTLPPGPASGPWPAVVLVHGGPNVRGVFWHWDAEAQFLASRGYVVIQPEFRGSTGYGYDHFKAGLKQWGMSMQDDLADAALWAVKQGWADPKRIGIMGASYGGYATLMGLIKHPQIFRAGVEWAGVTDISLMFNTPYSDASEETLNYSLRTLIGDPEQDAAQFNQYSPLLRAAELKQPLLMAHGLEDLRVPIVHANRFRDAVQAHNKNVEYVTYDEGHGWRHAASRIDFWTRVEAFLDKNLR
ncbi:MULTISPECIES: S9 family peptidase [unclassified Duganella]|uniref:alpha/beta hydrolase family protein n=1 Tax=unclassified Duganella TaxID=2636909 RepID=UPI00088BA6DC|nr:MULTISPECIES: alpha/beta fold hydrolase [unclassified Duganella]SDH33759.1 Prolyl oligopeptidase family protein [Duganella sp. OV458]SDK50384.1 Prolyl oligopeptidase family protein [Duganella sp. OV510]